MLLLLIIIINDPVNRSRAMRARKAQSAKSGSMGRVRGAPGHSPLVRPGPRP